MPEDDFMMCFAAAGAKAHDKLGDWEVKKEPLATDQQDMNYDFVY
jgi:hypothetical protein